MKIKLTNQANSRLTIGDLPVLTVATDKQGDLILRTEQGCVLLKSGDPDKSTTARHYYSSNDLGIEEVHGTLSIEP